MIDPTLRPLLERIADALERMAPPIVAGGQFDGADAFVWQEESLSLKPVPNVARVEMNLLRGVDQVRDILLANTGRFAKGLPANNALLWGARGMGKSSLVKAAHAEVNIDVDAQDHRVALIEIHREDIESLPVLLRQIDNQPRRCIVFCDDLSFDLGDASYKSLKAVLEGGLEGRPDNVIFYATSNRRHLMPRDMIDNERATAINPGEAVEEKVSLSDRFGLWLGFHSCGQDVYLDMVNGYAEAFNVDIPADDLRSQALEWATTRGARSGRVAWQFIQDVVGRAALEKS